MYILIALLHLSSVTAECTEGLRDDPAVRILDGHRYHWVHFLPYEWGVCEQYKELFITKKVERICGCKQAKNPGEKDTVLLRCAHWMPKGKIISKTTMVFYYYPDSIKACNRTRDKLMFPEGTRNERPGRNTR